MWAVQQEVVLHVPVKSCRCLNIWSVCEHMKHKTGPVTLQLHLHTLTHLHTVSCCTEHQLTEPGWQNPSDRTCAEVELKLTHCQCSHTQRKWRVEHFTDSEQQPAALESIFSSGSGPGLFLSVLFWSVLGSFGDRLPGGASGGRQKNCRFWFSHPGQEASVLIWDTENRTSVWGYWLSALAVMLDYR